MNKKTLLTGLLATVTLSGKIRGDGSCDHFLTDVDRETFNGFLLRHSCNCSVIMLKGQKSSEIKRKWLRE